MERLYKFDNLKAILIFLVVFGHFLELVEGHNLLYLTIYSFHMPLFLFVSGYFAHFNKKSIWIKLIFPYVVFQILYTIFEVYILGNEKLTLTFILPRWIMWYLFALIGYYLLIPFFDTDCEKKQIVIIVSMVCFSILIGYDRRIGYDFSAARICTFMPFFFSGYYLSKKKLDCIYRKTRLNMRYMIGLSISIFLIAAIVMVLGMGFISQSMLYGSNSFEAAEYNAQIKLLILLFAGIWIVVGVVFMPNIKIPILSTIGRFTMPIYLLHGFIIKIIGKYYSQRAEKLSFPLALAFSMFVVLLLGNKVVNRIFNMIFKSTLS